MNPITPATQASIRRHLLAGALGGALLFVGAGGWAATAEFAGAVVTAGSLMVESDVKKVQHPTGGVVGELRVKNGDRVAAGDVLLRLDETVLQANLAIVPRSIDESTARRARLEGMHLTRLGTAQDAAYAAVYLASTESGFLTGVNLQLDGGSSIGRALTFG